MSFYDIRAPTEWVPPPTLWSSTTVEEVEACPRRWQLLRSAWGEYGRFPVRPSPAAIEGQIVHDALDRLARACGQRANPHFGTEEFLVAANEADFFPSFARIVDEWQQRLVAHPRPGPAFRLRATADELANRAVRMFREQYRPRERGVAQTSHRTSDPSGNLKALLLQKLAVSEVRLTHPSLPFMGILDRVQVTAEGVEIIDFKTGRPSEKHRRQLLRYALLWWRMTYETPARISAQYLGGAESWPVAPDDLVAEESSLSWAIPRLTTELLRHPAAANPGTDCSVCPVRARCAEGWAFSEEAALVDGRGDAELIVTAKPGEHGFLARSQRGIEVAVTYEAGVAKLLPALVDGQVLRVLNGVWREKRSQLEIKVWTELFVA
ncbi:MAG: PD-(D/E)XK nuclease family protein [Gemmatimonadales bacterium]